MVFMDIVRENLNHLHVSHCVCAPSNKESGKAAAAVTATATAATVTGIIQNLKDTTNQYSRIYALYLYTVNGWANRGTIRLPFHSEWLIVLHLFLVCIFRCVIMVCFNLVLIKKMERSLLFGSYSLSFILSLSPFPALSLCV